MSGIERAEEHSEVYAVEPPLQVTGEGGESRLIFAAYDDAEGAQVPCGEVVSRPCKAASRCILYLNNLPVLPGRKKRLPTVVVSAIVENEEVYCGVVDPFSDIETQGFDLPPAKDPVQMASELKVLQQNAGTLVLTHLNLSSKPRLASLPTDKI